MRSTASALALAAAVACIASAAADAQQAARATFAIRADPSVAARLDRVLAEIAEPVSARLQAGQTPEGYLRSICGERAPTPLPPLPAQVGDRTGERVRFIPCIRQLTDVVATARPGDTREELAVRMGLRPSASGSLAIVSAEGARRSTKAAVMPGDTATAAAVPAWTPFTAKPGTIHDRAGLVAALSAAVGCPSADEATCLTPRGILVLARTQRARPASTAPAGGAMSPVPQPSRPPTSDGAGSAPPDGALESVRLGRAFSSRAPRSRATPRTNTGATGYGAAAEPGPTAPPPPPPPQPPPPAPPPPAPTSVVATDPAAPAAPAVPSTAAIAVYPPALSAADLAAAHVAPEQWPYDRELVAAVLDAAKSRGQFRRSIVGVADNGLASADALPLPSSTQVRSLEHGPADEIDNNKNGYLDDIVGAGVRRDPDDQLDSGDVALCASMPDIAALDPARREEMSHGSVVSSIAAGLPLGRTRAGASPMLPRILFYRLVPDGCAEDGGEGGEAASVSAIDFLSSGIVPADVINLSSFVNGLPGEALRGRVNTLAGYDSPLLVVAAGNGTEALDEGSPCPPCLADPENGAVSSRVVVVGAATSDLRPAAYSGRGYRTTRLFAPAEPVGALDIAGGDASAFTPATSYAAPLAALAAALIKTQVVADGSRLRNRLLASTWPLFENGAPVGKGGGRSFVGVLDLLKAAAARFDSVEVVEVRGDRLVRVTHVGDLADGLNGICPGQQVDGEQYMSLMMGGVARDGSRSVTVLSRVPDQQYRTAKTWTLPPCRPSGSLTLRELDGRNVSLPLSAVTQILFHERSPDD